MKLSQFCIQHSSCPWHHSQWHQPTKKHAGTYQVEYEVISCPMGRAHKRIEDGPGLSWCRARPTGLQYILKQANKWRRLLIGHWRGDTAPPHAGSQTPIKFATCLTTLHICASFFLICEIHPFVTATLYEDPWHSVSGSAGLRYVSDSETIV